MPTEWPMEDFVYAWKIFRDKSNENIDIADHILSRSNWPKSLRMLRILDLGCGDGRLLARLTLSCNQNIDKVHLLDPDEKLLNEAIVTLQNIDSVKEISSTLGKAEEHISNIVKGKNIILAVHIVYFFDEEALRFIIKSIPEKVPIYIILDDVDSVFTRIWKYTAPKYHERSIRTHAIVKQLSDKQFSVNKSTFTTHIQDPYSYPEEIRNHLISMVCYANSTELPTKVQENVRGIVNEFEISQKLFCNSVCYEIVRMH